MKGFSTSTHSSDVIVLEEPAGAKAGPAEIFSFTALKRPFHPEEIGTVENREEFSQPLPRGEGQDKTDAYFFIKAPGTKFYIPPQYAQFLPVIRAAIEDHYKNGRQTGQDYCTLSIMQSPELLHGTGPHIDANFKEVLNRQMINNNTYIAYDKSPTWFYDQPVEIDLTGVDPADTATHNKIYEQINRLVSKDSIKTFPPFTVVHFDSTNIHQGSTAPDPGMRTVCIVAFCPRTNQIKPENLRNPALQGALKKPSVDAP